MADKHTIFGVHITNRFNAAREVQTLLTDYGCNIKTRLGLHEATDSTCAVDGILLLELVGEQAKIDELFAKLSEIEHLQVKRMEFK